MAESAVNWRIRMGIEGWGDDDLDMKEFFAEGARMGEELQRRMEEEKLSEGSEEEEKPSEGSEKEIEGEEKAVEMRARKRCDLHMDEEDAMRAMKEMAMGARMISGRAMSALFYVMASVKTRSENIGSMSCIICMACEVMGMLKKESRNYEAQQTRMKPSEGPDEEIGGEDMDVEKAVKTRVRKRCDAARAEEMEEPKDDDASAKEMEEPKDDAAARAEEMENKKSISDFNANEALEYPRIWNTVYSDPYGSYEDTTSIPAMRFTDSGRRDFVDTHETLQIFSVRVVEIEEGLQWPLDIYGMIAIRDVVDYNRNIIFDRKRDNCHTITAEDPFLELVGPCRAVLLSMQPTVLEVWLYLKGDTESDDKEFSLFITSYVHLAPRSSMAKGRCVPSRLSTLEITVGYFVESVEATLSVKVAHGSSWPDGYGGEFAASTESIDDMEILLLAFGDQDKLPASDDGKIKLSRRVISVEHAEHGGQLRVSARALRGGAKEEEEEDVLTDEVVFTPQEAGQSEEKFKVGSCEMVVTVAWSLLSSWPLD